MDDFVLPPDPLLQRAVAPPQPNQFAPQNNALEGEGWNPVGIGEYPDGDDYENQATNANKRPRLDAEPNFFIPDRRDRAAPFNENMAPPAPPAPPVPSGSLRQYTQGLISMKKLSDNSIQELHRFASAAPAEREMMAFALNLEIRDGLEAVSKSVVSTNKNIKTYTAAAFFSPRLRYYTAPRTSARSKELQKMVYDMLATTRIAHLPPTSDAAGTNKVLTIIGSEFTDHRSTVKGELARRKPEDPRTDIGSFVSNLTRNINIKVTKEHYGRVAFLSREYRSWESRSQTGPGAKLTYWEWADKALENVRKETHNDTDALNRYFREVLTEDEKVFSAAVGRVAKPEDRDEWQKHIEAASGDLSGK